MSEQAGHHRARVWRCHSRLLPWRWAVHRPDGAIIAQGSEGFQHTALQMAFEAVTGARLWWMFGQGKP